MAEEARGMSETGTSLEADNAEAEEAAPFDWNQPEDSFVPDIPDSERIPLPPSTVLQGRHRPWEDVAFAKQVPDLKGRDLAAGKWEADRMTLGEQFDSFDEFDRCLQSWCVLHGRVAAKKKTQWNYCVWVCRFAKPIFEPPSKIGGVKDSCTSSWSDVDEEFPPQQNSGPGKDSHCMVDNGQGSSCENSPLVLEDQSSQITQCSQFNSRLPLGDISVNTMSTAVEARVFTRTWLPSKRAANSVARMKTGKKVSQTGACGQLSRFLPPPIYDDPANEPSVGPCPFRVRCQRQHSTGKIHITVCELTHMCPQYKHKWWGPIQIAKWLGVTLANQVTCNVKVPGRELLEGFQTDYHRNSTYPQCWGKT